MPKTFKKMIVKPGRYRVRDKDGKYKWLNITKERIGHWVHQFKRMQDTAEDPESFMPMPYRHDKEVAPVLRNQGDAQDDATDKIGGWWNNLWQDKNGRLWGSVRPTAGNEDKINDSLKWVSMYAPPTFEDGDGHSYEDAITHIASVTYPRVNGQGAFEEATAEGDQVVGSDPQVAAIAAGGISLSLFEHEDNVSLSGDIIEVNDDQQMPETAEDTTLEEVLEILRELGLALPDDTTPENFLKNVKIAAIAVKGAKKTERPETEEPVVEQPAPPGAVSMSATELNDGDKAKIAFAEKHGKQPYRQRIKNLVGNRISAQYAKEKLVPMLDAVELSFTADGDPECPILEVVLSALEELPDDAALHGKTSTQTDSELTAMLGGAVEEHEPDQDQFTGPATEEVTEERGNEIAIQLLKQRGHAVVN